MTPAGRPASSGYKHDSVPLGLLTLSVHEDAP